MGSMASKPPPDDFSDFAGGSDKDTRWSNPTIVAPLPDSAIDTVLIDPAKLPRPHEPRPAVAPTSIPEPALEDDPEGPSRVTSPSYGDWIALRDAEWRREAVQILAMVLAVMFGIFVVVWLTVIWLGSY